MSETESFDEAMTHARSVARPLQNCRVAHEDCRGACSECRQEALDRLQAAHDEEIKRLRNPSIEYMRTTSLESEMELDRMREYDRGYEDGQHFMDAEHRAVAMRLHALPMNRVEYDANIYDIIEAVCGTNKAGDTDLRDRLVDLMGGVSDDICDSQCRGACAADCGCDSGEQTGMSDGRFADDSGGDTGGSYRGLSVHMDGLTTYDVLENERHKAVRKLEERKPILGMTKTEILGDLGKAVTNDPNFNPSDIDHLNLMWSTLIHLLGGDQSHFTVSMRPENETNGTRPNDVSIAFITDELRKFVAEIWDGSIYVYQVPMRLLEIADRIDGEVAELRHDAEIWYDRAEELRKERDDAREKYEIKAKMLRGLMKAYSNMQREVYAKISADGLDVYELAASFVGCDECGEYKQHMYREFEKRVAVEQERNKLQAECDRLTVALDELHADPANDVICRLERERDDLQAKLEEADAAIANWRERGKSFEESERLRLELQSKLKEYDQTHIELPKDADGKHIHMYDALVSDDGEEFIAIHFSYRDNRLYPFDEPEDEPWVILYDGDRGPTAGPPSAFRHARQDDAESIVRDLTLGKISERDAVRRIGRLANGRDS